MKFDIAIIGAGIVGTSIADALSIYDLKIVVLEKMPKIGLVQSKHNSAIIHAGNDPVPNSLKAKLNVLGNQMYDVWERELELTILRTGAFTVAFDSEGEEALKKLYKQAQDNGVKGVELISGNDARKIEPNLSKKITKVLHTPTTKIINPTEVVNKVMNRAIEHGVTLLTNSEVTKINKDHDLYKLTINNQDYIESKIIINAGGVFADEILKLIDREMPFRMKPTKGEYYILSSKAKGFVNKVIYPLPTKMGKGILLVPQTNGEIMVGPSSYEVTDKVSLANTKKNLRIVRREAKKIARKIPFKYVTDTFAGIRSKSDYHDFYIKESYENKGVFHIAGMESPGLSSAPAIGKYVADMLLKKYQLKLKK